VEFGFPNHPGTFYITGGEFTFNATEPSATSFLLWARCSRPSSEVWRDLQPAG